MKRVPPTLLLLALLTAGSVSRAFDPPVDSRSGVTLRIAGLPEKTGPAEPLTFSVTLKSERPQTVTGRLTLRLNGDWELLGPETTEVSAEPGKIVTLSGSARTRGTVLDALYPVHARFAFEAEGKTVELNPVAIFEAVRPDPEKNLEEQTLTEEGAPRPTEEEWQAREHEARAAAQRALTGEARPGCFRLLVNGRAFGAAVVPGNQGLCDGVIAVADDSRHLTFRGFTCEVDAVPMAAEKSWAVTNFETAPVCGGLAVLHRIQRPGKEPVTVRAKLSAEAGALRITWDMPGVQRDGRGSPRFTRLGIGAGSQPVWRAYAGFGNVIENPAAFQVRADGFRLSTRHVGADYPNGLSLLQACDIFPDQLVYNPTTKRFALETQHDATFLLIPSADGAFAAARAYRDVSGFEKGPGVDALRGRVCLDQWSGDYLAAAAELKEAARYGLTDSIFVKHTWQRWGFDYRLPEIYPPAGGLEPFLGMRSAAREAGMLFCPHDNYIDFYPDAEGFSYDQVVFDAQGRPMRAWFNKSRAAQSYRWLPHGFHSRLEENTRLMRDGFAPDSLFIDVFTAVAPFDYFDRAGAFHPRTRTVREWRAAFDAARAILGPPAPMLSEAGTDALIGSVDGAQADHFPASRWLKGFSDAERTPWHDMATHGRMVLFAGGLGHRYSARDWDDHAGDPRHGYGSDDYLSNTVLGGRNPMCDGPFSRRAVMTYWLLHDVCAVLSRAELETHRFEASLHRQQTTFRGDARVWTNREANGTWSVADNKVLPPYGFYAAAPEAQAGVVLINGHRVGFARSKEAFFADARPVHNPYPGSRVETSVTEATYRGAGAFEVSFAWNVREPVEGYTPFIHVCSETAGAGNAEKIAFQASMALDPALLGRPGRFTSSARITVPPNLPAGEYRIRYGLFRRGKGDRLVLGAINDPTHRVCGGVLNVQKEGAEFTAGSFTQEKPVEEDLNTAGNMIDFGPIVTNGAFRLIHSDPKEWLIVPLPGSHRFQAEIRLSRFNAGDASVREVAKREPQPGAADAEWRQEGGILRVGCDGNSFAYRVIFR